VTSFTGGSLLNIFLLHDLRIFFTFWANFSDLSHREYGILLCSFIMRNILQYVYVYAIIARDEILMEIKADKIVTFFVFLLNVFQMK
jgi:hypothetical protein